MALTLGRWLRLLLLLLGVVFVALAPPEGEGGAPLGFFRVLGFSISDRFFGAPGRGADPERARLSRVERAMRRAERQYAVLQRRAETGVYLSQVRQDTGAVRLLFQGPVPAGPRSLADRTADLLRRNLELTGTGGVPIVLVVRTGEGRADGPDAWAAFVPEPAPGGCGVVITLDSLHRIVTGARAESRLGYCTYLAAFGHPGRGMRELLDARRWDLTSLAGFTLPPHFAPEGQLDLRWWRSLLTSWDRETGWWGGRSPTEVACQLGRPAACVQALGLGRRPAHSEWGMAEEPYFDWFDSGLPLQRVSHELLPDLTREFGAEAVRRWWQDDRPVEQGFQAATGQPLGEWLAGYLQRKLGRTLSGPAVRWQSAVLALVLCALALGLAALAAERREVS